MDVRERLLKQLEAQELEKTKKISIQGFNLAIYPNVFVPNGSSSLVFSNFFKIFVGIYGLVLDMGCGSGILSLLVAKHAKRVIAVDISENAVKCTKENMRINNIGNVEIRKSDLFENVPEKFDLIIFNPPFMNLNPLSRIERAFTDKDHETLAKFFREVKEHLSPNGRILMEFSDMGNENYLNHLISKYVFKKRDLYSEKALDFAGIPTEYYIFELTLE